MEFIFFDQNDNILFRRSDAVSARFVHEELKHTATFPDMPEKPIQRGMRVGWLDRNKNLLLFEIRVPVRELPDGTVSYTAEHICISELMDEVVQDKRAYATTAAIALSRVLEDTGWNLGLVDVNPTGNDNFYWISAWEAVVKIKDGWNVRIKPRLTFDGTKITGRYLDIFSAQGTFRGVRLQLNRNASQAGVTYDDRNLVTALYGRGKGELLGTTEEGNETYGRKIMFDDVEWSIANGDPANKPLGQTYVEDVEASALYGRNGRPRFGIANFDECEDKAELLALTWQELQRRKKPSVTIKMTLLNLRHIGYEDQGVDLNDLVNVIIDPLGIRTQAKVVQLDEDLIEPENTRPVIGDYLANVIDKLIQTKHAAEAGQQIAQAAPSLLRGYIDTSVTTIMSSKTRRETLADGSEIYVTDDGTKAVRFTGAGILVASGKDATGDWDWRTAITGGGIEADVITSGVINANLVKILGTERFYWDKENIYIIDPENTGYQIRIGMYDGKNNGIAYTKDGGATWTTAIGFDGVNVSATGFSKSFVQLKEPSSPGLGDRWTQTEPRTWQDMLRLSWGDIKDVSWDEASGFWYPKTYVWDGDRWVLESDMRASDEAVQKATKVETQVQQNTAEIKTMARAEDVSEEFKELRSDITQDAKEWTAEFNRVGLAGAQTGITKVDEKGVEVTHSNIGGKTSMNADGFKLYDAKGNVIGGLMNMDGTAVSVVQRLANLLSTTFYLSVSPNIYGDGENGVEFVIDGQNCGAITAQYLDGDVIGMRIRSYGDISFQAESQNASFAEIYGMGRKIRYAPSDPGGNDGDIWLCPTGD